MAIHPRICGENKSNRRRSKIEPDTSPHMRGECSIEPVTKIRCRYIPAYAGRILPRRDNISRRRIHPRICGENAAFSRSQMTFVDASPHMRGESYTQAAEGGASRCIPAYAGRIGQQCIVCVGIADASPHMRGEYYDFSILVHSVSTALQT